MKLSNGVRNRRIRNIFSNRKLETRSSGTGNSGMANAGISQSRAASMIWLSKGNSGIWAASGAGLLWCTSVENNINKLRRWVMWMYSLNVSFLFSCKSTIIKIFYVNPDGFKTVQRTCYFIKTWVIQIGYDLPGRVQNKKVVRATAWRIFCNVSLMTDVTWTIIDCPYQSMWAERRSGVILTGVRSGFFKSQSVVVFTRSESAPPLLHHEYNSCQQPVI